ncbi:MAG: Rha family transcriptional regulator [Chroococcales cyanobacterium]
MTDTITTITVHANEKGELVVDSRLVAEQLDINHANLLKTIKKHQTQLEQAFGVVVFETRQPPKGSAGGRPEVFALLTEPQAITLMTFSRNTEKVVQCKIGLVKAFEFAKAQLKEPEPIAQKRQLPQRDAVEFIEAAEKLSRLQVNAQLRQLLEDALVDDLSLGKTNTSVAILPAEKEYTMVKVRARELGYGVKAIGNGSGIGRFVANRVQFKFHKRVGDYQVKHYEVCPELDAAIHEYFA